MSLSIAILAAGQGTRMKSDLPKVVHPVAGRPLIAEVLTVARSLQPTAMALVVGHGADTVRATLGELPDADYVLQAQQLGTGHAVAQTRPCLEGKAEALLVLYGDTPLMRPETLQRLLELRRAEGAAVALLTFLPDDPTGYGRILRDAQGHIREIVEHKDASPEQRQVRESNSGILAFDAAWLWPALARLTLSPQGEYYLTDLVALAVADGRSVAGLVADDPTEVMGINDRMQLAQATAVLFQRRREALMRAGVTMVDPATVYIGPHVEVGRDTVIHPNVTLDETHIGPGCELGPNSVLRQAHLGAGCRVLGGHIYASRLGDGVQVGPFAVVRGGSVVEAGAVLGIGPEVNRSHLGPGVQMSHFGYLGDATIGASVNIGAGTVTCNYDGSAKHPTTIEPGAFIGSDTLLIAPITVGAGARTGAGAVVTHDVPPGETVIGVPARERQH